MPITYESKRQLRDNYGRAFFMIIFVGPDGQGILGVIVTAVQLARPLA
jgi:hypothetical protein